MQKYTFIFIALLCFHSKASTQYFSKDYEQARSRFTKSYEVLRHKHPQLEFGYATVPSQKDSSLTINYVYLPASEKKKNIMIITSGVHGPEAFAGSAAQLQLIHRTLSQKTFSETGFLIVHSVNPYGFKYLRRQTENNVDLNRNFAYNNNLFSVKNPGYKDARKYLESNEPVGGFFEVANRVLNGLLNLISEGYSLDNLIQFIGQGQYEFPKGLYYGGSDYEPHVDLFHKIVAHYTYDYSHITMIDIHTGIGPQGQLTLMTGALTDDASWEKLTHFFPETPKTYYELYNGNANAILSIQGDIIDFIQYTHQEKILFTVTAEFGTLGDDISTRVKSFNRMVIENQAYHNGYLYDYGIADFEKKYLSVFYPQLSSWKRTILKKSDKMFDQVLSKLESN